MRWHRLDIDDPALRNPDLIRRLVARLGPWIDRWFRPEVRGLETLPDGPVLFVGNHSGGMATPDSWVFFRALIEAHGVERAPFGLGHEVAISLPVLNQILVPLGAIRACHDNALRLFRDGHNVLVYPGGDVDAMRPFWRRDEVLFDGRTGYVRLAQEAGVPIVPVVSAGSHEGFLVLTEGRALARLIGADRLFRMKVWPLILSFPWGFTLGPGIPYLPVPTRVLIEVRPPIEVPPDADVLEVDARVRADMQATLTRLADERRDHRERRSAAPRR